MFDASVLASSGRGHSLYDRALFFWASFLFLVAVLLGGGTRVGLQSDEIVEILSVPLLVAATISLLEARWHPSWRVPLAIVVFTLALPLLQLVPLPPAIWTALPGRAAVVEVYQAAGVALDWRPLSLAPFATLYSFLSLLPAAAIFVYALQLDTSRRYALLVAPLALAGIAALVGVGQFVSRGASTFGPNSGPSAGYAIGFFANRNHFAALIYASLPFAVVWTARHMRSGRGRMRLVGGLFGSAVVLSLLFGLSAAFSRAGVALGIVSLLGSAFIIWRSADSSRIGRWPVIVVGVLMVGFAVILQLGLVDLLIQRTAADNARTTIASLTLEVLARFNIAGSGFGTFVPLLQTAEKPTDLLVFFINHAHNDFLELALEGGILSVVLMLAFLVWYLVRFWSIWLSTKQGGSLDERALMSAASLSIGLLLLHSLLDYPLRTLTLMCFFAFAAACLCPPVSDAASAPVRQRRRRAASEE
jgi:O-antigen ligase